MRWLRRLFGCRHRAVLRDRAKLHGVMVAVFRCDDCGHVQPQVEREPKEHRAVVKAGAVQLPKARLVVPKKVESISGRRRK
jgi:uncharacterized Zn finger protein